MIPSPCGSTRSGLLPHFTRSQIVVLTICLPAVRRKFDDLRDMTFLLLVGEVNAAIPDYMFGGMKTQRTVISP